MHLFALALAAALLAGCASSSSILLSQADRNELARQREVTAFYIPSAALDVRTRGDAAATAGPALPGAVDADGLRTLLKEDPAALVGRDFLDHLKIRRALGAVPRSIAARPSEDTTPLPPKGASLDFRATTWTLAFLPERPTMFRVSLATQARLVRSADGKLLWRGACRYPAAEETGGARSWDDITANGGRVFRTMVEDAVRACGTQLIGIFAQLKP